MKCLLILFSVAWAIEMGAFSVGPEYDEHSSRLRSTSKSVGQTCKSPGGIINQHGDCVCCTGWSGTGCSRRNLCYDKSCSNGGHCNPETGLCMCPKTHTGPQCELPSCSFHGYYDLAKHRCSCLQGFAGTDCEQCAIAANAGQTNVCVPSPRHTYVLMTLPSAFAAQIVSGEKRPAPSITYNGIYPNSIGKDGKKYGCNCRAEEESKKRWISNGNLYLYNETVVNCIEDSSLSTQQMEELIDMWYTAYSLEQAGRLNDNWYIIGIVFIIAFILETIIIIIYCVIKNYDSSGDFEVNDEETLLTKSKIHQQRQRRKRPVLKN